MKNLRIYCAILVLGLCESAYGQQTIRISWPSKQLISQPITVNGTTSVTTVVTEVNDILYSYEGWVTSVPVAPPIPPAALVAAPPAGDPCADPASKLGTIEADWKKWQLNPWVDTKGNGVTVPQSVALATTMSYYKESIEQPLAGFSFGGCTSGASYNAVKSKFDTLSAKNAEWLTKMSSSHTFTLTNQSLAPFNNYTIHLKEYGSDSTHPPTLTNACTDSKNNPTDCQIQYQPRTDLISTSGGFLFSELGSRSYVRQSVPNGTDAVLGVNGGGRVSSLLTALLNVQIPYLGDLREGKLGLALSLGPALQLNSGSSGVSKVGMFTGLSLHFWKYVYLTGGAHIGDFADFPAGFTHAGQDIPSSFTGNLTPTTRTTARFAFGVTFRGFTIPTGNQQSQGKLTTPSNTQ